MSEGPRDFISPLVSRAASAMTEQTETYLRAMAGAMDLTIEEMAEKYVLEYHPLESQLDSGDTKTLRFIQNVRLVRRPAVASQSEETP